MKRFILALALTATPAWAENVTVFVVQEDGGVIQRPGNLTYEEAVLVLGGKAPREGTTGVVLEKGEPPHWTDLSPSDVDKEHGGDGDPVVELFPRVKDERDNKEIILFPEEDSVSDKITPCAGTWVGQIINQDFTGCPAGVAQAASAQVSAMDGNTILGTIDASFTPDQMFPDLDWLQTGPNTWLANFSPVIGGGPASIRVQFAVWVVSPDKISIREKLNFKGPLVGNCQAMTEVDALRQ